MRAPAVDARLAELIATSPHNLVSARDRVQLQARHLPECAALAGLLRPAAGACWIDLGTGGGLPGLVLAHRHAEAEWTLVDARRKKAEEVRRFAAELGIRCGVAAGRAELLALEPTWRGSAAGVVARALAPLGAVAELARPLMAPGGWCVAVKGRRWAAELSAAAPALERLAMEAAAVQTVRGESVAVWLRAVGPVPDWLPRGPGAAQREWRVADRPQRGTPATGST